MADELAEDLADFDDHDLGFEDTPTKAAAVSVEEEATRTPTPSSVSSSAPRASSSGPRKIGWKQFNTNPLPEPSRKRERIALDPPSRSSLSAPELSSTVLISKLPPDVKLSKLVVHFETFGTINEIIMERSQSRGFVRFENIASAQHAVKFPFHIFKHRMSLDRVKESPEESVALKDVAAAVLSALQAKQSGVEHDVVALTVEHLDSSAASFKTRMSYRAPDEAAANSPAQRELQKAGLKVLLEEKNLDLARKNLASCREGMKMAREKLNQISKGDRNEVLSEVTSFAIEIKNAQANVIQAESNLQAAKREQDRFKTAASTLASRPDVPSPAAVVEANNRALV